MCGIVYTKAGKSKKAKKTLMRLFERQKERGIDGFGYCAIENGYLKSWVRTETLAQLKTRLDQETANEFLFHHRFPTSTANLAEAAHPIRVSNPLLKFDYFVVHNGIIYNCDEMKAVHEKIGFEYSTLIKKEYNVKTFANGILMPKAYTSEEYNDSEAMAIDFALALEGTKEMESHGPIAFMALAVEKETNKVMALMYGRNSGNPLKAGERSIYSKGGGLELDANVLYTFDYETQLLSQSPFRVGKYAALSTYTGYDDYRATMLDDDDLDVIEDMKREKSVKSPYKIVKNRDDDDARIELYDEMSDKLSVIYEDIRQIEATDDPDHGTLAELYDEADKIESELQVLEREI